MTLPRPLNAVLQRYIITCGNVLNERRAEEFLLESPRLNCAKIFCPTTPKLKPLQKKNAQNACVVLEKCTVSLKGTVGRYSIFTTDNTVNISVEHKDGDRAVYVDACRMRIDDLISFADELKAVARCANTFDIGTAMW